MPAPALAQSSDHSAVASVGQGPTNVAGRAGSSLPQRRKFANSGIEA